MVQVRHLVGELSLRTGKKDAEFGQAAAWALKVSTSHVGESMALAQRLVLFGIERLAFQIDLADLWEKDILR